MSTIKKQNEIINFNLRIFFYIIRMENYEQMVIPILKNLARERGLRG